MSPRHYLFLAPFVLLSLVAMKSRMPTNPLRPDLQSYVEARIAEFDQIPAERKTRLQEIAAFVRAEKGDSLQLLFVCTHNSRRSQLSQAWAAVGAAWYGVGGVTVQSAGIEQTAFNERAVAALLRAGFILQKKPRPQHQGGLLYGLVYGAAGEVVPEMYSKTIAQATEGSGRFLAIMVCSDADEKCPVVPGAAGRFSLPYMDPKESDGTPQETTTYDERCAQIAREELYLFSQVAGQ